MLIEYLTCLKQTGLSMQPIQPIKKSKCALVLLYKKKYSQTLMLKNALRLWRSEFRTTYYIVIPDFANYDFGMATV